MIRRRDPEAGALVGCPVLHLQEGTETAEGRWRSSQPKAQESRTTRFGGEGFALDSGMERDTSTEAEALRLAALRRLDGPRRLAQALEMSEAVHEIAEAGRRNRGRGTERSSLSVRKDEAG